MSETGETRKRLCKTSKSETERCWADVPEDVLSLILSQIFLRDRCNFKLVCKSWNLICPVRRPLPPPVNSAEFDSPCLMVSQRSGCSWKIFHSLYNDFYYLDFPELVDSEVLYSKDGWLLMSKNDSMLFFFNPFTKEKIELPPINRSFFSVCFTSPPSSPNCIVFGIISSRTDFSILFNLIKVGDESWKSGWSNPRSEYFWISNCPPVFLNGVYYYLDCKFRNIMTFDLINGKYDCIECEEEEEEEEEDEELEKDEEKEDEGEREQENKSLCITHQSYMVEVEGDICGVFVTNHEKRVRVRKLDLSKKRWVKMESLEDKCLYVSVNGSFADTCSIGGTANKIYFNKFHGKSGVMYSLTSRMYHSIGGGFASKEGFGLTEVDFGVWIKPNLHQMRF